MQGVKIRTVLLTFENIELMYHKILIIVSASSHCLTILSTAQAYKVLVYGLLRITVSHILHLTC